METAGAAGKGESGAARGRPQGDSKVGGGRPRVPGNDDRAEGPVDLLAQVGLARGEAEAAAGLGHRGALGAAAGAGGAAEEHAPRVDDRHHTDGLRPELRHAAGRALGLAPPARGHPHDGGLCLQEAQARAAEGRHAGLPGRSRGAGPGPLRRGRLQRLAAVRGLREELVRALLQSRPPGRHRGREPARLGEDGRAGAVAGDHLHVLPPPPRAAAPGTPEVLRAAHRRLRAGAAEHAA
mmetsp:Transcript_86440/g.270454  ORF Transcript_86440/g.270454 Transcript_86440/m.270454 type:complete len:238 (-) Transcript_86440:70-783(-)